MKARWYAVFLLGLMSLAHAADTAWISDDLQTSVSDKPNINAKFVGTVVAGEPITVLGKSDDGNYLHIKTANIEGWVWARNVMNSPSRRAQFETQSKELAQAKEVNSSLSNERENTATTLNKLQEALKVSRQEAENARAQLSSLQRASGNVVAIDKRNRELENKLIELEQSNLRLTHANARLEESQEHNQMIIGGVLFASGIVFSWLMGFLYSQRRRSSYDSLS